METASVPMGARGDKSLQKEIQMLKTQIAQELNLSTDGPTSPHGDDPEELSITHTPSQPNFKRQGPTHSLTTHQDVTNAPGHGVGLGGRARL